MKEHIRRRVRERIGGLDIDASLDAVVAVNTGTDGSTTVASSRSTSVVSQRPNRGDEADDTDRHEENP